jgi:hypothetical protein
VRVVDYPDPYPLRATKVVTIVDFGGTERSEKEADLLVAPIDTPPAGWYPDPYDPTWQRVWNGVSWTEERRPRPGLMSVTLQSQEADIR